MNTKKLKSVIKYNVFQVANCFIKLFKENKKPLTHMQLQKLVYYSYGFYLYWNNKILFENNFQPWAFGPVEPELYKAVRNNNSPYNVVNLINSEKKNTDCEYPELKKLTSKVYNAFLDWDAKDLSILSHNPHGSWFKAKQNEVAELKDDDISSEIQYILTEFIE